MLGILRSAPLINRGFGAVCSLLLAFFGVNASVAQVLTPPTFDEFRVENIYRGAVQAPNFGDLNQYSGTDIRCFGKDESAYSHAQVNFAGHLVLSACSCGSGCHYLYMWDAVTGRFYQRVPPAAAINVGPYKAHEAPHPKRAFKGEQYRPDSDLLIVEGCIEDTCECATWYYKWTGSQFNLLFKEPVRMPGKCLNK